MNYFLFLKHPLGKEIYEVDERKRERVIQYFASIPLLRVEVEVEGKKYQVNIDYELLLKESNFDCFNCVEHCCGDLPTTLSPKTLAFIKAQKIPFENFDNNKASKEELCNFCVETPDKQNYCLIHKHILDVYSVNELLDYKPLICSLWPLEVLEEAGELYLTLPDDFTNDFTKEDYYTLPCLNKDYVEESEFREFNPKGFLAKDYEPFIIAYKNILSKFLGEENYWLLLSKLDYKENKGDKKREQFSTKFL